MDDVKLEVFPSTRNEALALEYAKSKLKEQITPEEFAEAYRIAYKQIKEYFVKVRQGDIP